MAREGGAPCSITSRDHTLPKQRPLKGERALQAGFPRRRPRQLIRSLWRCWEKHRRRAGSGPEPAAARRPGERGSSGPTCPALTKREPYGTQYQPAFALGTGIHQGRAAVLESRIDQRENSLEKPRPHNMMHRNLAALFLLCVCGVASAFTGAPLTRASMTPRASVDMGVRRPGATGPVKFGVPVYLPSGAVNPAFLAAERKAQAAQKKVCCRAGSSCKPHRASKLTPWRIASRTEKHRQV